ncbi:helix-turn-helix transcriptional regulator [Cyanobacterium aponinum]|uniref:Transcriptional regulator, AraC family n=1 Tax=Cyanobacterium aponinum (strain PCC 10605) TaxID=755178 RepID=K9Z4N1_CYAAP|nr:AraC family transcriptional regulator [Cyanobacterium aponinum]AFZ54141.1 transcriptional regulator, AraC family [Cyanobacterium aponinum PCC 10605]
MAKIITSNDWEEIWAESHDNGTYISYSRNKYGYIIQGKHPYLGRNRCYGIDLRNGLSIEYNEVEFSDDLVILRDKLNQPLFGLSFFLSGKVRIERHGLTGKSEESIGRYYSDCNCDVKETEWWTKGEKFSRIYIEIEPQKFFNSFSQEDLSQIPPFLRQTLVEKQTQPYYDQGNITREMQKILRQILNCPYQGFMKQIYLESKSVELIALHCQQFQQNQLQDCRLQTGNLSDIDRIYQAKEILLKNLENPPTLMELSRRVGLNDFKLKRGFRELFGTSTFKYLHDYRLEQAKQLLTSGEMKVEDVALKVGFNSRSYFASAFRQKYGVNPKQFQKIYN